MAETNQNTRLEAFCDGVFAIAITLLIIEIHPPSPHENHDLPAIWGALRNLTPAILAFVLSFLIILITWVNHHAMLKLVPRTSASFVYANGFLLLTVVFIPFPTAFLGEFLWTENPAPAVVLYNAVLAIQAIGWILVTGAALNDHLTADAKATATVQGNRRNGYFAFVFYSLLAVLALWFPLVIAAITIASWLFWLVLGIRMRVVTSGEVVTSG